MSKRKYIKPSSETTKENSVTVQEVSSEPSNLPEKVEEKTVGGITEENKTETEKVIETSDSVSLESIQGLNPTFAVLDEVSLENADTIPHDTHSTVTETETQEDSAKKVETLSITAEENVSRETIKEPSEEVVTKPTTVTPEIKETYVINLKDKDPTQEDVVKTLKETAINTPVSAEATMPSNRLSAVNESNALIESVCKGAEVTFTLPLQMVKSFVSEMDPLNLVSEADAANKHVMLYRAIINGIENVELNFNVFFGTLLSVINIHSESVFHEKHLLRGFAQANFKGKEANQYVSLLTLFKAVANPDTRSFNIRGFNLTKTLEGLSERAQQKVRTFFNV